MRLVPLLMSVLIILLVGGCNEVITPTTAPLTMTIQDNESVDSPYPRIGTGEILILLQPEFAGATFDLVGATGKAYYQVGRNVNATLRLDLTATTDNGVGGFLEVPPGTFRVEFGGTAKDCIPTWAGWPGDVENSVRVRVLEGHVSNITLRCPLPQP